MNQRPVSWCFSENKPLVLLGEIKSFSKRFKITSGYDTIVNGLATALLSKIDGGYKHEERNKTFDPLNI